MKRKYGKRLIALMSAVMLLGGTITADAANSVNFRASIESFFEVRIPAAVSIVNGQATNIPILGSGDIAGNETLSVSTDESFQLVSGENEITVNVNNIEGDYDWEQLKNGFEHVMSFDALQLRSGQWSGTMPIYVGLERTANYVLISQEAQDITPIPDKYNTGVQDESILTVAGVQDDGEWGVENFHGALTEDGEMNFYYTASGEALNLVLRNIDFSEHGIMLSGGSNAGGSGTITFENCKLAGIRTVNNNNGAYKTVFNNCTIGYANGSYFEFNDCHFTGDYGKDATDPWYYVTYNNCYFSDYVHAAADNSNTKHIDGIQIYGVNATTPNSPNTDIHMNNCRFEMPWMQYTYVNGELNCPITFTMNYESADNISFRDIYVNGGGYYAIAIGADEGFEITNTSFENVYIGNASKNPTNITYTGEIAMTNVVTTPNLYVSSVWKDGDGVHLSVTNDTAEERTLKIVTSAGEYDQVISACPKMLETEADSLDFDDLPFDIEVCVPDAEWVVCYDITNSIEQIRFVNWGAEPVSIVEDWEVINPPEEEPEEEEKVYSDVSGTVSETATWALREGVLTISGTGEIPSYGTNNAAPWGSYVEEIEKVYVNEGITLIGNAFVKGATNLREIYIADTVEEIGNYCFSQSTALEKVMLPASVTKIGSGIIANAATNYFVYYEGSAEQFAQIEIADGNLSFNQAPKLCEYTITEDDVTYSSALGMMGTEFSWTLKDGVLNITGSGDIFDYKVNKVPSFAIYYDNAAVSIVEDITEAHIGEGITKVGNCLFYYASNLDKLYLGADVATIGQNNYLGRKLSYAYIPVSVATMDAYAFDVCEDMVIDYAGTAEEWAAISNNSSNDFTAATINYEATAQ